MYDIDYNDLHFDNDTMKELKIDIDNGEESLETIMLKATYKSLIRKKYKEKQLIILKIEFFTKHDGSFARIYTEDTLGNNQITDILDLKKLA